MSQKMEITCGEGQNAYQVVLIGKLLSFSDDMDKNPAVTGKEGEERIAAILAIGGVLNISRRKNGQRTDGPNKEPAVQTYDSDGHLICMKSYKNGELLNAENYEGGKLVTPGSGLTDRFNKAMQAIESYKNQVIEGIKTAVHGLKIS